MNAFSKTLAGGVAFSLVLAGSAQAKSADRNRDGLPDRWERAHHLSLHLNQARRDTDHDGLNNRGEYRAGFDPRDRDSDDDGIADGRANAGSVTAYKDGVLTVSLAKGGTLTARVTDATWVRCRASAHTSSGNDESGGYYGNGGGTTTVSDDHGGHGGEAGDDHGSHGNGADDTGGYYGTGGGTTTPADDSGGHGGEAGDDHGGHGTKPGDDHGNHVTPTPSPTTPATGAGSPTAGSCELVVGAKVREAEISARDGEAIWKQVKLQ